MSKFTHLHVHSHYSLLDGLPQIKDLVASAKKKGFDALALTDHGNVSGVVEFYKTCKAEGIRPILGCEVYVAPITMADRDHKNKYHHLVLWCENNEGYRNLLKLVTTSYLEGFYYKPRVDKELLKKYGKGIIASSACFGGEIPKILRFTDDITKAKKVVEEYQNIFGHNNFFLEMMDLPALEGQSELNNKLIELSKLSGAPLIVTRDVHYVDPEDAEAQDILTCIRDGKQVNDPTRRSNIDLDCSLAREKDIISRFKHIPQAIENTVKIAKRCNVDFEFGKNLIPKFKTPKDSSEYLRELCYNGLKNKYNLNHSVEQLIVGDNLNKEEEKLKERLDYELKMITEMGFVGYFLIVWDFVNWAKNNGIVVGPGRGSAAGAIVAYTLDITEIDPLKYGLLFERFLNPARVSMPDIDMDFADDNRDRVIDYVADKYGRDKVAQICTFGTMAARAAVKDVGRAFGISFNQMNDFAKLIPSKPGTKLQDAIKVSPEIREAIKKNELLKKVVDNALKIEGMVRHMSVHACAVVIADEPLTNYTALQHPPKNDEDIITQFSAKPLESLGLLKMDFLGLRNLTVLQNTIEVTEKTIGKKIFLKEIPIDDKKTFDLLTRGDTTSVFQLESAGMKRYLKELKPTEFEDIIAMVSLYRPGPMEWIPDYIAGKHGTKKVTYAHESLEPVLKETYGIAIYQEQILQLAQIFAGFSLGEADILRRAIGKKIIKELEAQRDKFIKGAMNKGYDKKLAINIFENVIEPFAGYGFNKSHGACYAMIAYQTAYLKANFPIQYMTAVLITESGDVEKVSSIISECSRMGISVLPPDVNESFVNFAMIKKSTDEKEHIRFGLSSIKNVGEHISRVIYKERKNNGKFKSLEDMLHRCRDKDMNKKSLESLVRCGALDSFGIDRGVLLGNTENILNYIKYLNEIDSSIQDSLFAGTNIELDRKIRIEEQADATKDEKLHWEKELLGLYVTAHPFEYFQKNMDSCLTALEHVLEIEKNNWVVVGGVVEKTKKKITKTGKMMMFVTIADTTSSMELLVFPKAYETTKDIWQEGDIVCVVSRTPEQEGDNKLIVEKAYTLNEGNMTQLISQLTVHSSVASQSIPGRIKNEDRLVIRILKDDVKEKGEQMKEIFKQYPGNKQLYLDVEGNMIKTSFQVSDDDQLIALLEDLIGNGCFTTL